jgi:outer membrane receptor protein involved in Fe transport
MSRCPVVLVALAVVSAAPVPSFAQRQSARVHGTVIDSQGQPAPNTAVVLADPLGAALQRATTDPAGRFTFEDVAPGRFTLRTESAAAGQSASIPITVESALPVEVVLRLPPRLQEAVQVEGRVDAVSTRASLGAESLAAVPVRVRGRSLQDAIATLPGWATEDNGLLHARGVDDGFLYVIDGVPVYERLDTLNGVAPDTTTIGSINVVTGYVPPEFGYKAGGVIEVRSLAATDRWRMTGDVGIGTFTTAHGGVVAGGRLSSSVGLHVAASSARSDRFLDPVHPDNLHNTGGQGATSGDLDSRGGGRDRVSLGWMVGRAAYDVPNTDEQQEAGQDQRQRVRTNALTASWQRAWTDRTVSQVAAYGRRSGSALEGSAFDVPLFADADRTLGRTGAIASVSHQRGAHLLKAGLEGQALRLEEDFTFAVTDEEQGEEAGLSDSALEYDLDNPFAFSGRARPALWSVYVQDTWHAGARMTIGAGLRFDRSMMLLDRQQWSPRVGVSFQVADATVLRASVSRYFQPPQPEYLLLSSSEEARELSPFETDEREGGADVEPERQWSIEAGVEHRFPRWRFDTAYWRRDVRHAADPNVFVGTTVIFPNAVDKGRAQGVDVRLEVPRWRGWSGYASSTVSKVIQTGPVTGGLFLEDEIADIGPGVEFLPDHDQRVAIAGGVTWEHARSGLTTSLATRYESGTPIQRDDDDDELEDRPGAEMADFERGRVKPRFLVSLLAALPLADTDRLRVLLRASLLNLFDDAYAFNFGNPFSGTHFGAPRTAAVSLEVTFR